MNAEIIIKMIDQQHAWLILESLIFSTILSTPFCGQLNTKQVQVEMVYGGFTIFIYYVLQ